MIRNIPIGTRAFVAFSSLALLTLAVGIFSLIQISTISSLSNDIAERRLSLISLAGQLQRDFLSRRLQVGSLLDAQSADAHPAIEQKILEHDRDFQQSSDQVANLINTDQGRALHQAIITAHSAYLNGYQQFLQLFRAGQKAEAVAFRQQTLAAYNTDLVKALNEFVSFQTTQAKKSQEQAIATQHDAKFMLTGLIILAFVISGSFGFLFTRSLTKPIGEVLAYANQISTGDLSAQLQDSNSDEPAALARAMNVMRQNLRSTLLEINQASALLASTSEELSVVTEQSTRHLQTQNDELAQAATAVTEMTAAVDEVARNATDTSKSSEDADREAQNGKLLLQKTITTIERLMQEVSNSQSGVGELALRVKDIASVLDVIRGIAEQTNLLALNAAIEAARAGESGRGFAVVADEVRALAHRTQQSTKQIETMISSVQNDTNNTVNAIKASSEQASSTLTIAHQTSTAFDIISRNISLITQQNVTIATAVEEQAMVAREVDRNLVNIRDISVQTASGANQTSASSEELARLAQNLNQLVLKFRL
jgi:methyl-accepting chemotaxis protein